MRELWYINIFGDPAYAGSLSVLTLSIPNLNIENKPRCKPIGVYECVDKMDNADKNIDESWKEYIEKEKEGSKKDNHSIPPEPDFNFFITTLALQASINLGAVPNPVTNTKEDNPAQAKFIIDTLQLLKEKTKGNLNTEENNLLDNLLYELRMQYISKQKEKKD